MDKNLFLLRRKEHVLLQGIDLAKPTVLGHEFEFETTRNKVDVIIVSKNRNNILNSIGNGVSAAEIDRIIENGEEEERAYEGELIDIETLIRQAIDDELRRRKDEECPEERPYLPNYDDKDGIEPHYGNWDDDSSAMKANRASATMMTRNLKHGSTGSRSNEEEGENYCQN